ncbi:taurine ABC transporter substrate-binding protein [Enterococcus sp.]|uniref:taurine ABC transporter substrate-binding protein n=1 Tax=Enterococcus sp. TaxID=35783 RepID=UPI002FC60E03
MKKWLKIIILGGLVLCILSACVKKEPSETSEGLPKAVNIGMIRVPNDKQVAISMKQFDEYFQNRGIETKFLFFDSGVSANQAFASGSIDFAEMGYTNAVVALSKELPVELIWLHDVLGENEALVVQEDSEIQRVKDLKGKKIATPFSSTSHFSLLKALEEEGIQEDVTLLDMETADIVAAWERKDIDAAYTWEPTLSRIKETGRVITTSADLAAKGHMTTNVDLVRKGFSEKYPDLVVDYLACLTKGQEYYTKDPNAAATMVCQDLNITKEEALTQMEASKWLTPEEEISADYLGTNQAPGQFHQVFIDTIDFLIEQKSITERPTDMAVHQFINSSYAEQLVVRK